MPRYLVERTFPDGLHIPTDAAGAQALGGIVATNAGEGVNWVHSYVSADTADRLGRGTETRSTRSTRSACSIPISTTDAGCGVRGGAAQQWRPSWTGSALLPRSESVQWRVCSGTLLRGQAGDPPQRRPRPPGSALAPESESEQPVGASP